MKRSQPTDSRGISSFKEPKIVSEEDNLVWSNQITSTSSFLSQIVEQTSGILEKESSGGGFQLKEPKIEEGDTNGNGNMLKNKTTTDTFPKWTPRLTSYLDDDSLDFDCGIELGSSVLFDSLPTSKRAIPSIDNSGETRSKSKEAISEEKEREIDDYESNEEEDDDSNEEEEDYDEKPKKRALAPNYLRAKLSDAFQLNNHPTALEMQRLAEECAVRYRTVFDNFEERRKTKQIKCEDGDPCEKIKRFIAMESEQVPHITLSEEEKSLLEEAIETNLLSRKKLSVGYLHVIMEIVELPANYIRGQCDSMRRRMMGSGRAELSKRKIREEEAKANDANNSLSIDKLRQLEDAYLHKKYHSEDKEWTKTDIRTLAATTDLPEKTVENWINRRKRTTLGLEHSIVDFRRDQDARLNVASSRKLSSWKLEKLIEHFDRNSQPERQERIRIGKELGLDESQVRNFYNKRRISIRKQVEMDDARKEFLALPLEKRNQMERLAKERRKPATENMEVVVFIILVNRVETYHF
ncbi:hypothetical protein CRE_28876 [Caenorhabditis remanei]|uniref:Homeodomain-only protein n=1 Tax=Caenorhabditis remanei TaxID=31234 RepID=E3MXB6_CAERE|nr:hypothetical protein CRE_28876 [Caenorhabditis remanei]